MAQSKADLSYVPGQKELKPIGYNDIDDYIDWYYATGEFDSDNAEQEREARFEENDRYLDEFEEDLTAAGLKPATIDGHIRNVAFYLNRFLVSEAPLDMRAGCYLASEFLGEFFIRRCVWSTPRAIRSNATSFKKFYKSMLDRGHIRQDDYDTIAATIKQDMNEWCDLCEAYNDPHSETPFSPFGSDVFGSLGGLSNYDDEERGEDIEGGTGNEQGVEGTRDYAAHAHAATEAEGEDAEGQPPYAADSMPVVFDMEALKNDPTLDDEFKQMAAQIINQMRSQGYTDGEIVDMLDEATAQFDRDLELFEYDEDALFEELAAMGLDPSRPHLEDLMMMHEDPYTVVDVLVEDAGAVLDDRQYDRAAMALMALHDLWFDDSEKENGEGEEEPAKH